ncbi:MAG: MliC family protein [Minisyncoccia bacterium]
MKNALVVIGVGAIVLAGGWWYLSHRNTVVAENSPQENAEVAQERTAQEEETESPSASIGDENLVEFQCDDGKEITAVFTRDIVGLTLSDGRQMELRQALSGSGIRYVNANATIIFHGKGEGAFLTEGNQTTFENCVAMI